MIERIEIRGEEIPLEDVFASVTIRHGRGSVDDGPLASTVTLSLVDVERELSSGFRVADALEIFLADDEPRFVGRITDAAFSDGVLSIIGVSSLSWLARRKIGLGDWPSELWSARVLRALGEAGARTTWEAIGGTWADAEGTWADAETALVVEVGEEDPMLAARLADETTLGSYLGSLIESNAAAISQLPNGAILVQELTARKGLDPFDLDPDLVAANPEWSMVDEVTNAIALEWSAGTVTDSDPLSIEAFEEREDKIDTELLLEVDATDRARREIDRRAWPRWEVARAEVLELDDRIAVGASLTIEDLEDGAPASAYVGVVEGWEDHVESIDGELEWKIVANLSHPRLSGIGLAWEAMPVSETWGDAGEATWLEPELALAN